jgi:hypothetical protein
MEVTVSFTPGRGKNPWYPWDRRLCGPQSRSRHCGENKILTLPTPKFSYTLKYSFTLITGVFAMVRISLVSSEGLTAMSLGVATHQRSDMPPPVLRAEIGGRRFFLNVDTIFVCFTGCIRSQEIQVPETSLQEWNAK